jgi:hypothetical protein
MNDKNMWVSLLVRPLLYLLVWQVGIMGGVVGSVAPTVLTVTAFPGETVGHDWATRIATVGRAAEDPTASRGLPRCDRVWALAQGIWQAPSNLCEARSGGGSAGHHLEQARHLEDRAGRNRPVSWPSDIKDSVG